MITPDWVRTMARHNRWQNGWMTEAIQSLPDDAIRADRGLFFGSILGTANHLLWGDLAWMERLGFAAGPDCAPADNTRLTPDASSWATRRAAADATLCDWADGLEGTVEGDVLWRSALTGAENRTPRAIAITHLFLHGVHHRGQIHAGLTQAGIKTQDTDLPLMPEAV